MILVLSAEQDPMGLAVAQKLSERKLPYSFVSLHEIPHTVRMVLTGDGQGEYFLLPDGERLDLAQVGSLYHRVGFSNFEVFEEYSEAEVKWVNLECQMALTAWLNSCPGLVVNRPSASFSNASKPYQIAVLKRHGFSVPETLVTNLPGSAEDFYHACEGQVIYKSISYQRSIVQKMKEEDLERLETLTYGPIQLQRYVPGFDVRVHVVGERGVFACRIDSEDSDYRYDTGSVLSAFELDEETCQRCIEVSKALGLTLTGIDLRITPDGEAFCFEVNPSPAYRWYERKAHLPITDCLIDLLAEASSN